MKIQLNELNHLCVEAFLRAGVSEAQAVPTVAALVVAESQGIASHGISRVPMYLAHVRHGRVNPQAVPTITHQLASSALINANDGFAFPACDQAIRVVTEKATATGIAIAPPLHQRYATRQLLGSPERPGARRRGPPKR